MAATKRGAYASVLFDEVNAKLQIITAEKDVIEHWWHLVNQRRHVRLWSLAPEGDGWNGERRTCNGHEISTCYRSHGRPRRNIIDLRQGLRLAQERGDTSRLGFNRNLPENTVHIECRIGARELMRNTDANAKSLDDSCAA